MKIKVNAFNTQTQISMRVREKDSAKHCENATTPNGKENEKIRRKQKRMNKIKDNKISDKPVSQPNKQSIYPIHLSFALSLSLTFLIGRPFSLFSCVSVFSLFTSQHTNERLQNCYIYIFEINKHVHYLLLICLNLLTLFLFFFVVFLPSL